MSTEERVAGTKHWDKYGSGFPGGLSDEQQEILTAFIASADTAQLDMCKFAHETHEVYACRLLRARKFDATEAAKMLAKSVEWRIAEGVEQLRVEDEAAALVTCTSDEMQAYYGHTWMPGTYDKHGRPVWVEKTGKIDIAAMQLLTTEDHILRWHIRSIVRVQADATAAATERLEGKTIVNNCCTILDLEGFSSDMFSSRTRAYLKRVAGVDQDHFPETMGHMFVINTPGLFSMVWAVAKGFVDDRTRAKIEILGGQSSYLPRLLEFIPADQLPVEYGGTKVIEGGLFPQSRTQKTVIASGKDFIVGMDMAKGQRVRVRWFTRPGDIKFALSFTEADKDKDQVANYIVPMADFKNSGKELQEHFFDAPEDGHLTMHWDNKSGWRQREVHHRWDYVLPNGRIPGNGSADALASALATATAGEEPTAGAGAGTE